MRSWSLALMFTALSVSHALTQARGPDSAADLYKESTDLLKSGRRTIRAISLLKAAVKIEPDDRRSYSALGTAYACRFAYVASAYRLQLSFSSLERLYQQRLADWQAAQGDRDNPLSGTPPPGPPQPPATRDDGVRFTLSPNETQAELVRLAKASIEAFDAESRIPIPSKAEEVESLYTRGWALLLMHQTDDNGVLGGPYKELGADEQSVRPARPILADREYIECFQRCSQLAPDDPDVWHSRALSYVPDLMSFFPVIGAYRNGSPPRPKEQYESALAAMERAIRLQPSRFELLYLDAVLKSFCDRQAAEKVMSQAVRRQGDNAVLWYTLAEIRFRLAAELEGEKAEAMTRRALNAVESGNAARQYRNPTLMLPIPKILARAWLVVRRHGVPDEFLLPEMRLHFKDARQGDTPGPDLPRWMRCIRAQFGMGMRLISATDGSDLDWGEPMSVEFLAVRRDCAKGFTIGVYDMVAHACAEAPYPMLSQFLDESGPVVSTLLHSAHP